MDDSDAIAADHALPRPRVHAQPHSVLPPGEELLRRARHLVGLVQKVLAEARHLGPVRNLVQSLVGCGGVWSSLEAAERPSGVPHKQLHSRAVQGELAAAHPLHVVLHCPYLTLYGSDRPLDAAIAGAVACGSSNIPRDVTCAAARRLTSMIAGSCSLRSRTYGYLRLVRFAASDRSA